MKVRLHAYITPLRKRCVIITLMTHKLQMRAMG